MFWFRVTRLLSWLSAWLSLTSAGDTGFYDPAAVEIIRTFEGEK
jgi:hypothetical protein